MATGLNVNDVVTTTISLSAVPAGFRNFGACLCWGPTSVIDVSQRIRQYSDLDGVASDFGTTAPEYLWADEFFSQDPQPNLLYVGRFAQTATSAVLHGAGLTPLQQLIAGFNAVTSGSMYVAVDGVPYALTGLNFSSATNLNGVASTIQTALAALSTGSKVVWGANNNRFDIISGSTGVTSTLSYAKAPTAVGLLYVLHSACKQFNDHAQRHACDLCDCRADEWPSPDRWVAGRHSAEPCDLSERVERHSAHQVLAEHGWCEPSLPFGRDERDGRQLSDPCSIVLSGVKCDGFGFYACWWIGNGHFRSPRPIAYAYQYGFNCQHARKWYRS